MKQKINTLLYGCLILLSSITAQQLQAQTCVELVTNGSFETVTTTPPYNSQPGYPSFMPYATGWNQHVVPNYNGTPDLFTTSSPTNPIVNNSVHIPCSFYGYQNARTGNSYAGLLTVHNDNSFSGANCSEFITTNFTSTLTAGKIYEVSLWVSRADLAGFAINGLGVWIGTAGINAQADIPTYNCPTSLLNNDAWTQITFPYCANGDETLIIIGGSSTTYGSTLTLPSYTCTQNSNYNNPTQGAGSYIFIDDVSVKEVAFTVPTQTLCAEYSGTFTAVPTCSTITTSALTYTWNYGDGTTVVSTNTLNVTTHSYAATPTGQYNATLTVGNGTCTNTYTYNVVIPNVPITITTNTNTICNGTVNFTATPSPLGSYTYTWSLKDAATGTVIPTSNYTITAGTTATPAINFANINQNVNVCVSITSTLGCNYTQCLYMPSCCSTPAGATKYSNRTFTTTTTIFNTGSGAAFGGTITVNTGVTLQIINTKVQMDPNTKFVINGTGKLTIVNSYLYGCNAMWDGIYPLGTNTVIIRESRIEDAQRVLIDSVGGAVITFTNNYVNKNYQGLVFKAVKTNTSSVNVNGNLFTCSSMPTPTVQPWGVPAALKPNLTNAPTFGGYSSVNLMTPYNTLKSFCGIYSAGAAHTGKANSAITIGTATNGSENVFDKMQYGAYNYVSNMVFQNNVFQNIKSSIAPVTSGTNTAVFVLGPFFGGGTYYTQIGGASTSFKNTFKNNDHGVANVFPSGLLIQYNKFETQSNGVSVTVNNTGKGVGITNNNFYQNGIGVNCHNNSYATIDIKDNNFDNTASAVGTFADNYAIRCTEVTRATSTSSYPAYDIDNNKISGYYNGIHTAQTLLPKIHDNEVHMRSDNSNEHWQLGIYAFETDDAEFTHNIVDMSSFNQWAYWQQGISLSHNIVPHVGCNSVNNVCMAMVFNNDNTTAAANGVIGNYMQNAAVGIWLVDEGEIGDQAGNTGSNSSDNAWAASTYTYVYSQGGSNPNNDVFFTQSGSGFDLPIGEVFKDASIGCFEMFGNNSSAAGTGSCVLNSATPSNLRTNGAGDVASLTQKAEAIALEFNEAKNLGLNEVSNNLNATNDAADNSANHKAIVRRHLLSNIVSQQVDVQNSVELASFMNVIKTENIGLLLAVDSLIHHAEMDSTQITTAQNANAAIVPNNQVEQSQQQFNALYLSYIAQNRQLSNNEIARLETIAMQCPTYYGSSVFQARTVLFDLKRQHYRNVCENTSPFISSKRLAQPNNNVVQSTDINVYPNPANTVIFVNAKNYDTVVLKLYDVMGHLVIDKIIANNEKLDINNLSNGIYIYKLYANDVELKVGKLIITH